MALIAYGAQDDMFNARPARSLFHGVQNRVLRSNFTYRTLANTSKRIVSLAADSYVFDLKVSNATAPCDLFGDCYLHIGCIYNGNIQSCTFEYKNESEDTWTVLETLVPKTLEAFAAMYPSKYRMRHQARDTMIPLPFFFAHATQDAFPMMTHTSFRICVKMDPAAGLKDSYVRLVYKAIYLDKDEHHLKLDAPEQYHVHYVFSTTVEETAHGGGLGDIRLKNELMVKDMQLFVTENNRHVIVPEIVLKLNGHTHYRLNSVMATDIIPSKYYQVLQNTAGIHYLPFCYEPLNNEYTSAINFSRMDHPKLFLDGLERCDKPYQVTIVSRHYNTMFFYNGKCGLTYVPVV